MHEAVVDPAKVQADFDGAVDEAIARAREARATGDRALAVALIEQTMLAGAWRRPRLWSERLSLMASPSEYEDMRALWLQSPKRTHTSVSILRSVARAAAASGHHDDARALLRRAIVIQSKLRRRPRAFAGRLKRQVRARLPVRRGSNDSNIVSFEQAAAEAMKDLHSRLEGLGVRAFLISGTLLGYLREGGFISWDKDIDVGIFTSEIEPGALEAEFDRLPDFNVRRLDFTSDRLRVNHLNGTMIDVFPHYPDGNGRIWHDGTATRWWNSPFDLKQAPFLGLRQWIPEVPERYLEENYGSWRTPDPRFDARLDAPNAEVTDRCYFDTLHFFGLLDAVQKGNRIKQDRFARKLRNQGEGRWVDHL